MATRPPRLRVPNTYFHVTTRGTNRWNIFLDDQDRRRFLHLLGSACDRYGLEVNAYCLMGNHLHLVVYCPDPVLSSAMRDLKSRYAVAFNKRHHGTGPVFEAPFVEVPILDDGHLITEIRYAHRNPLDLSPDTCLRSYPWSSHGVYLGLCPEPAFMNTRIGRELFGPDYRSIIETPRPQDEVQNRPMATVTSPGDVTVATTEDWSLAGIIRAVALAAECPPGDVRPGQRNGLIGAAVLVALDVGYTAAEIAEPFGYRTSGAVRMAARRARTRPDEDRDAMIYRTVVSELRRSA
jgi:REP element-mobilizing transposase RayT